MSSYKVQQYTSGEKNENLLNALTSVLFFSSIQGQWSQHHGSLCGSWKRAKKVLPTSLPNPQGKIPPCSYGIAPPTRCQKTDENRHHFDRIQKFYCAIPPSHLSRSYFVPWAKPAVLVCIVSSNMSNATLYGCLPPVHGGNDCIYNYAPRHLRELCNSMWECTLIVLILSLTCIFLQTYCTIFITTSMFSNVIVLTHALFQARGSTDGLSLRLGEILLIFLLPNPCNIGM